MSTKTRTFATYQHLINKVIHILSTHTINIFSTPTPHTMSDGNFNRQLLPKTDLSSGLRAGKAQMRQKAERAFDEVINDFILDEGELKEAMKKRFMELLRQ